MLFYYRAVTTVKLERADGRKEEYTDIINYADLCNAKKAIEATHESILGRATAPRIEIESSVFEIDTDPNSLTGVATTKIRYSKKSIVNNEE